MRRVARLATQVVVSILRAQARALCLPGTDRLLRLAVDPDRSGAHRKFVATIGDCLMQIDTASYIEWAAYMYGGYEREGVRLLRRLVHSGAVVVDVGANVGTYTLPLARSVLPLGSVHAFEPHPVLCDRLATNVALNNLRNVTVYPLALGARAGHATLHEHAGPNRGTASLRPQLIAGARVHRTYTCQVSTLDAQLQHARPPRLDLVKLDAEGADYDILVGARRVLDEYKPAIYLEVAPQRLERFSARPTHVRALLGELGYRIWRHRANTDAGEQLTPLEGEPAGIAADHEASWLAVHPASVARAAVPGSVDEARAK